MYVRSLGLALIAASFTSCATSIPSAPRPLDFFVAAPRDNPWNAKITDWQTRHSVDPAVRNLRGLGESELGIAYVDFTRRMRHQIVTETVAWVQELSRNHYRPDGERDHWATLGEVIHADGDDCDGLDLLTFVLLRRLGFKHDEIFRAIVVERETGQHHMVTLWFDRKDHQDPVLLDPTGVVTSGVVRLSEVPSWEPIELFDEQTHFAVADMKLSHVAAD